MCARKNSTSLGLFPSFGHVVVRQIRIFVRYPPPLCQHWHVVAKSVTTLLLCGLTKRYRRIRTAFGSPQLLGIAIYVEKLSQGVINTVQVPPLCNLFPHVSFEEVIPPEKLDVL